MAKQEKFDFMSLEESGEVTVAEPVEEVVPKDTPEVEELVEESIEEVEEVEEFTDEVEEQEVVEKVVKKKDPYTAEEIQDILKDDGEVDTERLSPAEQATMKAMQRAFTPKLQEAADLRREIEAMRSEMDEAKPKEQPADIYEAYDEDPDSVIQYVDSQINELISSNDPDTLSKVRQLDSLKYEFNRRDMKKFQERATTQNNQSAHMQAILEAVPDLASKQGALKEFALTELGFTEQELANETNPSVAGMGAARTIARINTAYDKSQARISVKKKRVKKATSVEKPSAAGFDKPSSDSDFQSIKAKAQESGNYSDFFAALEED